MPGEEEINDAVAYGVGIEKVQVPAGERYWKVTKVHHLTPKENEGKHHIFVDILDEEGKRIYGAKVKVTWQGGGEALATVDKPLNEPGTNFPLWKHQVCNLEVIGLPSERVMGLHTKHPDEAPGNTLFHHSFMVIFQRAVKDGQAQNRSVIQGRVLRGAGKSIVLISAGQVVASQVIAQDESYRFDSLPAGVFNLKLEGTDVQVSNIQTDGQRAITVNLAYPAPGEEKVLEHYLLFGPPNIPGTRTNFIIAQDYILRCLPVCGFSVDEALKARRVTIIGGAQAVSEADEGKLRQAGCEVERISGDSYAVERALVAMSC